MKREEPAQPTDRALDELAKALQRGRSHHLTDFLNTMARFNRYSLRNCLLIAARRPHAASVSVVAHEFAREVLPTEFDLVHYLVLLEHKPGASDDAMSLAASVLRYSSIAV